MWQIKFALLIYRKTAVKRTLCPVKHSTDAGYRQDEKASACHQRSCLNVLFKIQQCPCCLVTRSSWNVLRGFLLLAFSNNFIPKHQQEQHPPRVLPLLKVSSFLTLWRSMQIVSLKLLSVRPNTLTNLLATYRDIPDLQLTVIIWRPGRR